MAIVTYSHYRTPKDLLVLESSSRDFLGPSRAVPRGASRNGASRSILWCVLVVCQGHGEMNGP